MSRETCPFCEVCCHKVYDMEKHIQTFEHKRQVKKGLPLKCPVCKLAIADPPLDYLYQRSYPGEPEYISQRCRRCFKKKLKKERGKLQKMSAAAPIDE